MKRTLTAAIGLGLAATVAASPAMAADRYDLTVSTKKLERLSGARYEVWVVDGAKKFSAGTFNILPNGKQSRTTFTARTNPRTADVVAVTVEPVPDPAKAPSRAVILAGKVKGAGAALGFPVDLSMAAGSFILATPTDDEATNEAAGVWFLDPTAGPGPSLTLPALPRGWAYEGWGVTQGTPLSTGKFNSVTGADRTTVFSGPKAGPPFPGEDFLTGLPAALTTPINLANGSSNVVVSIEPDLGAGVDPTGPGPFSIKPLATLVGAGQATHASVSLTRDLSTVPTGTSRILGKRMR